MGPRQVGRKVLVKPEHLNSYILNPFNICILYIYIIYIIYISHCKSTTLHFPRPVSLSVCDVDHAGTSNLCAVKRRSCAATVLVEKCWKYRKKCRSSLSSPWRGRNSSTEKCVPCTGFHTQVSAESKQATAQAVSNAVSRSIPQVSFRAAFWTTRPGIKSASSLAQLIAERVIGK